MDIERERGMTIKRPAVAFPYHSRDGGDYVLNLVDTPGHVDFSYEVSRSISACEGAVLLIDASQGVEAQTLANMYMALEHNLEIIPVINKIDLPAPTSGSKQIDHDLGLDADSALLVSGKLGTGVDELLRRSFPEFPLLGGREEALKALIFDCHYDVYRGHRARARLRRTLRAGRPSAFGGTAPVTRWRDGDLPPRSGRSGEPGTGRSGTS
jgi:GTP-binding protein LepA